MKDTDSKLSTGFNKKIVNDPGKVSVSGVRGVKIRLRQTEELWKEEIKLEKGNEIGPK